MPIHPLVFGPPPTNSRPSGRLTRALAEALSRPESTMTIRAKFRCLEITQKWDDATVVKLMPVTKKKYEYGTEPMNFAENEQFWKYSPSGDCFLHFKGTDAVPFKLGSYYYIDMTPIPEGLWTLGRSERWGVVGAGTATFHCSRSDAPAGEMRYGTFQIGVAGTDAGPNAATIDSFGLPEKKWSFVFTLAHDHTTES